ncbi:MAG TPA: hypothetical protein DEG17_24150 [Cyanobacteria bacterium UBA11149]|nr:hypothetical protein [Cyanobacteria bacterium UBA11367]HBE60627.1 hypothetical protein [Cyanobacteria bacterium UBA11366]HBK63806.1 hypothetical protein [Cyanobacteria bacterium UBA11166]HBR73923.1 hypothetical protein [Cyanobacteria bacterium UBA11159]HBS72481.1 hypothetical protein [Cyanobacteria bacterium UBA11153]HBW91874.1 hypothetical protein [Cyanobacteria bacterium UBA11149]HCA96872.1 hypothetical protein [Cyanobacteria bacterium UBA9226]
MNKDNENLTLHLRPRITETLSLKIPVDTLESLAKIADSRDISLEALLKFYIGQGLRQDLTKHFCDAEGK